MKFPWGEVDWDFGNEGMLDGFREWFLWEFAKNGTSDFPEFRDNLELKKAFDEARSKGIIQQSYLYLQDDLYYLWSEINRG